MRNLIIFWEIKVRKQKKKKRKKKIKKKKNQKQKEYLMDLGKQFLVVKK